MADFLDSEAEESDQSEEEHEPSHEKKKNKRIKAMSDSEEEEDEDDRHNEDLKDLIDDRPIEDDESDGDSDGSGRSAKRKKSDDDDELDDRLEDEDYDLIEENLGVKVERRKKFKRLRRIQEDESDNERDDGDDREQIADQLFVAGSDDEHDAQQDEERRSESRHRAEADNFDEEEEEESDADDFIVDDDGRPITEKKKKRRAIFADANLQEGQDIFGVDFDYDEFDKFDEDDYEDESEVEDEYEEDGVEGAEKEKRPKKKDKKKTLKKSIFEIYEPSELKRGHFTDLDNEIRRTDIPERMQLREVPITAVPEGSSELEDEAEWIFKQAFCKNTVSNQDAVSGSDDRGRDRASTRKPPTAIAKIKQALDFIRNQQLEVPFIAFYRKEYVQPELNINDLWRVYKFDSKWCQLLTRKRSLLALFEKMKNYQEDKIMKNPDAPLPDDFRMLKDDDIYRLQSVQTPEELKDVHMHFLLYYAYEIPAMQEHSRIKEKERRRDERREARRKERESNLEDGVEVLDDEADVDDDVDESPPEEGLKQAFDTGPYSMCRKAGICGFAKKFGLTPEQFAENLRDNYQRHDVEQEAQEPAETAKHFITNKFVTEEDVLNAGKFVVARQIAREPLLRKCVRELYYERAKISIVPTKKGSKEIDENHNCYGMKFLKNKPVRDLCGEQFLKLQMAEDDKLLVVTINDKIEGNTSSSYLDEIKALYQKDEFAKNVQDWNALRSECVELALIKMVLPDIRKELKSILLAESKEALLKACCRKLNNWIRIAPYEANFTEEDDYEWETRTGIRCMGLAYVPDHSQAAFCAITAPDGDVTDYLKISHLLKRKNAYRAEEKAMKEGDLENIKDFIRNKKPHVIVIGGESREAIMIQQDLQEVVKSLCEEEQFPSIAVEIVDNELAKIYSNSNKGTADFREYPALLRQAVSLARRMQDPLVEFSQLCTADEEILCLRYNTLQDQLPKEELLENLYLEFINRTNEVGVDVNLAVQNSLTVNLVQFVCGLGPRKGQALIKILKQTNQRLENRTQLVTACHMGPKVFINCSGFIKIDTNSLGDSTEAYVEVLDGSRVHPETYEWARKMAVDALEYDDEDANPAGALEEILESPERLKDLDLDAFAVELERQGFGNKSITLYDIRAELNSRYKDLRNPFRSANSEELFDFLTKETPETFYVGKMILVTVSGFSHKKPQGDQLANANPVRNEETTLWQCPFCLKNDFGELSEVWNHFDSKECPGQATGVKLRLDNGLSGFIHIKNLSDKHVKNPEERVQFGQTIHCRITKIDVERFSVDCSSKSSDLMDKNHDWRPPKDEYYDQETEDRENKKEDDSKKQKSRQQYIKRVIVHPAFHNKSYTEAIKIMESMEQGEVIVRPSSKGTDHLTVSWKVAPEIYQHIDVREEGKENAFSLGQSLWIGNEEFEDLDEIIARYVSPMASLARDLLQYKYYKDTCGGLRDKSEELLKEEKKKNANKIHYFISASKSYPGKFLLSYLPRVKCKHEYVTVTPDGFRFRQQMFDSLAAFLKWFKEHFKDPMPGNTPLTTPRGGSSSNRTPYVTPGSRSVSSNMSSEAIQRVAQNMPSHMLHSLSQVANQTPHYPHTPGAYGAQSSYVNTPYTPSGQTPFMTPYQTPHTSQTPRYGQTTPAQPSNGPFLHPGAPIGQQSRSTGGYQQSPHYSSGGGGGRSQHHGSSPHIPSPHSRGGGGGGGGRDRGDNRMDSRDSRGDNRGEMNRGDRGDSRGDNRGDRRDSRNNNRGDSRGDDRGGAPASNANAKLASLQEESMDWEAAAEAWATRSSKPREGSSTPGGRGTPRMTNRTPLYDDSPQSQSNPRKTPKYDDNRPSNRDHYTTKSPRSARSTPRTNTSPHAMQLGDSTPLYDEN